MVNGAEFGLQQSLPGVLSSTLFAELEKLVASVVLVQFTEELADLVC